MGVKSDYIWNGKWNEPVGKEASGTLPVISSRYVILPNVTVCKQSLRLNKNH